MIKLTKHKNNPILKPTGDSWEALCVLNPAVVYDEKDKLFKMLYRAAGNDETHYIYLGYATSEDGIHFERNFDHPVLSPRCDGEDGGCIEDPRLVKMGDYYYLTYASRPFAPGQYWLKNPKYFGFKPGFGPTFLINNSSVTYLALTKDLINFKRCGRISDSRYDDRDVILFPSQINGKFYKLSRAMEWCGKNYENKAPAIWLSSSDDLMEWSDYSLLMKGERVWESEKIGGSTPPIKCKYGWMFLYHGVSSIDHAYRVGAVLLDKDNPRKIISRTKDFILEPEYEYETSGYYNGCVFPTGAVVKDNLLYVYYGAADKYICLATTDFDEFVEYLYKECRI